MTERRSLHSPSNTRMPPRGRPLLPMLAAAMRPLRARIEALLRTHASVGDFLESPSSNSWPRHRKDPMLPRRSTAQPNPKGPAMPRTEGAGIERRTGDPSRFPATFRPARFARPDRPLRGAPGPRPGGLRHRLPGVRRGAPACGGAQGAGAGDRLHVAGPQALPARSPVVGPGPPRQRRSDVRRRGKAGAVPGDGVHPRRDAAAAARPGRPAGCFRDPATGPADRRGAVGRPRHRPDPPRHQAGQRAPRRRAIFGSRSPTSAWPGPPTTPA